jgi:hypothetical protein
MAANPKSPMGPVPSKEPFHLYHAEAHILSGEFDHPIKQPIEKYGHVVLENTRRESLYTESLGQTNVQGLISFQSGHTRVAGTFVKNKQDIFGNDHAGWVTLSTAVLEGFNVLDIITADRVVAQVSTEHAYNNGKDPAHVPAVSFLGSRFENLRIGGYPVEVELDLGICGKKPERDRPYLQDGGFLGRVKDQLDDVRDAKDLPEGLAKKCRAEIAYIDDLKKQANGDAKGQRNGYSKLRCSLVKSIGRIPIPGVKTFGNLIFIPNFGTVALAEVVVGVGPGHGDASSPAPVGSSSPSDSNYFTLEMFEMKLGCPIGAGVNGGGVSSNGNTRP